MDTLLRLGAAGVITVASAFVGRAMAYKQARRVQALSALLEAVHRLALHMLNGRVPLEDALRACQYPAFGVIAEQIAAGRSPFEGFQEAKKRGAKHGGDLDCLNEHDLEVMKKLISALGTGGIKLQELNLNEGRDSLARLLEQARGSYREKGKLYMSLGLLGGLSLSILLV